MDPECYNYFGYDHAPSTDERPISEKDQSAYDDHCVPMDDLRDHRPTVMCWCRPVWDDGVWAHNAMDERERYETGELELH